MQRTGGVKAACDQEGCEATLQVQKGDDARWTLEWAGWQMTDMDRRGQYWVFCPDHNQPACTEDYHLKPHESCDLIPTSTALTW